jgi:hypothetical protein
MEHALRAFPSGRPRARHRRHGTVFRAFRASPSVAAAAIHFEVQQHLSPLYLPGSDPTAPTRSGLFSGGQRTVAGEEQGRRVGVGEQGGLPEDKLRKMREERRGQNANFPIYWIAGCLTNLRGAKMLKRCDVRTNDRPIPILLVEITMCIPCNPSRR